MNPQDLSEIRASAGKLGGLAKAKNGKRGRPKLPKRQSKHLNLRFRTDEGKEKLYGKLVEAAWTNRRSLNSEIEYRLLQSFRSAELADLIKGAVSEAFSLHGMTPPPVG